jgi:hypothetical protein
MLCAARRKASRNQKDHKLAYLSADVCDPAEVQQRGRQNGSRIDETREQQDDAGFVCASHNFNETGSALKIG